MPARVDTEFSDIFSVPSRYHDLNEASSKTLATALPPQRPSSCCIDLLPGTFPPEGRLYSILAPETSAKRDYIKSALEAALIGPSLSPARAGLSFVTKKDNSLWPCLDYRGHNKVTVKNQYPSLSYLLFLTNKDFHKIGSQKCMPSAEDETGRRVEDRFQHA